MLEYFLSFFGYIMKKAINKKLNFASGIKDGLPIGLGYLSVSFAFGVQASLLTIPVLMSLFMSMTNLTSAGQLAGLTVIASLGTIIEIILTQLVINSRYFLMSITLTQKLDNSFSLPKRLFFSAFITDEIFAVASSKKGFVNTKYFLGLVILPYLGWSIGTLLGAIAGDSLPSEISSALGIALYAMFIAIIIPPSIKDRGICIAVILGALFSCLFYFVPFLKQIPSGFTVIIVSIAVAVFCAILFPIKEDNL